MNQYAYRVEWSADDGAWVGLCMGFPSLSWLAVSPVDALTGVMRLVDGVVADQQANGENPPPPRAFRT